MQPSELYRAFLEPASVLGNEWISTKDECSFDFKADVTFDQVPKFGVSNRQIVSYLDTSLSSRKNILSNEIALKD